MKPSWRELATLVERRARGCCEYCGMNQALQGATFHIEHIQPRSKGGDTAAENLAWCCPSCNLYKSNRTHVHDGETGTEVQLFDPRTMGWSEHFEWNGYEVRGRTPIGRATIMALHLNHARRLLIRQAEQRFGLFPPSGI